MLGDARSGKFTENLVGFARTLRRAGLQIDSSRIATSLAACELVGFADKHDISYALEAVLVSEEQDREVFRDLFDAYFKDPQLANKLLAQMLPSTEERAAPKTKTRVREALAPKKVQGKAEAAKEEKKIDFDAAMTASDMHRVRHADFNALSASEYCLVESLAREIPLAVPKFKSRRTSLANRGHRLDWARSMRNAVRTQGDLLQLRFRQPTLSPLPIVILVDISGSMERYARLLMAFLHASLRYHTRKHMFAFGTHLTDLSEPFGQPDTDKMLLQTSQLIDDFAGGTRLGSSLSELRKQHSRSFVGRRTLVLIISDGLDTGEQSELACQLQWLKLHCGKLLWLNPLLRFDGYAPLAQGAAVMAKHCDGMLAVHNISKLETLALSINKLVQSR